MRAIRDDNTWITLCYNFKTVTVLNPPIKVTSLEDPCRSRCLLSTKLPTVNSTFFAIVRYTSLSFFNILENPVDSWLKGLKEILIQDTFTFSLNFNLELKWITILQNLAKIGFVPMLTILAISQLLYTSKQKFQRK